MLSKQERNRRGEPGGSSEAHRVERQGRRVTGARVEEANAEPRRRVREILTCESLSR